MRLVHDTRAPGGTGPFGFNHGVSADNRVAKPETSDIGAAGLRGKERSRVIFELLNGEMVGRLYIVNIYDSTHN